MFRMVGQFQNRDESRRLFDGTSELRHPSAEVDVTGRSLTPPGRGGGGGGHRGLEPIKWHGRHRQALVTDCNVAGRPAESSGIRRTVECATEATEVL